MLVEYLKAEPSVPTAYFRDLTDPATPKPEMSPEEMDRARKQFNDEMQAFQEMMNYNSDRAYGIEPKE